MKEKNILNNKDCGLLNSGEPKTQTKMIPIEKLVICPHNPRKRDIEIKELVKSIKETEVREVIEVHPCDSIWHVIAGQRRFLAAKKAGKTELECLLYPFDEKEAENWCMQDAFHKKEYHPLDISELAVRAVEMHGSIAKASKATGISENKLKKHYGIRGLVKELRERIGSQGTNIPAIETLGKIANLPEQNQIKVFEAIQGKTRTEANRIIDRIKGKEDLENTQEDHVILIAVSKKVHDNLKKEASKARIRLENYCSNILEENQLDKRLEK